MPELELDTVWEAGEMSTGDEIAGSSSVSSCKNNNEGIVVVVDQPNISRPSHKLQNEATSVVATKNVDTVSQVVPNKVDVNKVKTTIVNETLGKAFKCNDLKLISSQISSNENLSCNKTIPSNSELQNDLSFCEKNFYENTIQIER